MTEAEKMIRKMKSDHKKLVKQFDAAIEEASIGTQTHTRLLEAKSKANERHRAELVKFGVVPQDLQAQVTTSFHFVSHVPVVCVTHAAAVKAVAARDADKANGLYISDADEAIRQKFSEEFSQ